MFWKIGQLDKVKISFDLVKATVPREECGTINNLEVAMKSILVHLTAIWCFAISPSAAFACSYCHCFSDNTCSNNGDRGPNFTADCTRSEFTVPCSGDYTFYTEVKCTGGSNACSKCMSCASIFEVSDGVEIFLSDIHNNACNVGVCVSSNMTQDLGAGISYVMYVCKVPCPDGSSVCGENCTTACTAYGCVSIGLASGQCTP